MSLTLIIHKWSLNIPNQTYQTKHTKPTKPNLLNQTYPDMTIAPFYFTLKNQRQLALISVKWAFHADFALKTWRKTKSRADFSARSARSRWNQREDDIFCCFMSPSVRKSSKSVVFSHFFVRFLKIFTLILALRTEKIRWKRWELAKYAETAPVRWGVDMSEIKRN